MCSIYYPTLIQRSFFASAHLQNQGISNSKCCFMFLFEGDVLIPSFLVTVSRQAGPKDTTVSSVVFSVLFYAKFARHNYQSRLTVVHFILGSLTAFHF